MPAGNKSGMTVEICEYLLDFINVMMKMSMLVLFII